MIPTDVGWYFFAGLFMGTFEKAPIPQNLYLPKTPFSAEEGKTSVGEAITQRVSFFFERAITRYRPMAEDDV